MSKKFLNIFSTFFLVVSIFLFFPQEICRAESCWDLRQKCNNSEDPHGDNILSDNSAVSAYNAALTQGKTKEEACREGCRASSVFTCSGSCG